ncbi:DUF3037 domain-containing protein [Aridibaculum aurantiacum]|uniref:DUF3037 domain-containing protein n=1 Tax=Aridibaculum aurantiacum TaxID=2810307 RepID=UPI001A972B3D|nr:DUF3037 domain-containing protein [Aridibaculum aurantiacum]
METFYTIIKIAPNSIAGDSLSIGLLLRDGNRFWLHFSNEKKSVAKQLLGSKNDIVDFTVKQIQQKVNEANEALRSEQNSLFGITQLLTSDRFNHLSTYSNGIVRFTEPAFLNDTITEEKFVKLFQLLIDKTFQKEKPEVDTKETKFKATVEKKLIKRVQNKVHTNLELTPEKLPGLYFNFNIECLGKNGAFVGAKVIPFNKKNETIDKELSHYLGLITTLGLMYQNRKGSDKFYIIGDEPSDINSREHRTWENIKNNPAVTLLYAEQSDVVAEDIERTNASQFLEV